MKENIIRRIITGDFATNCWVYPLDEKNCALIDGGGDGQEIIDALDRLALEPTYILLTHGHFDHIEALPALAAAWPGAAIAIHHEDAPCLGPDAYPVHRETFRELGETWLRNRWRPIPSPTRLLEDGGEIGPFTVIHLPGHTPGSAAFLDREAGALFCGDTLFKNGTGRVDLPGGNAGHMRESLRRLFLMPPDTAAYPGHGGRTTTGQEKQNYLL